MKKQNKIQVANR